MDDDGEPCSMAYVMDYEKNHFYQNTSVEHKAYHN